MHRCFVAPDSISGEKIEISDPAQIRHIQAVLRLRPEDQVIAVDKQGNEYLCVIKQISKKNVMLSIKERLPSRRPARVSLAVACAIPKKARMDEIIDKLTQLGVERIIPLQTRRVIVKLDEKKKSDRLMRWRRIAAEAAKQSQANSVPAVEPVMGLKDALALSDGYDTRLIAALFGRRRSLKDVLAKTSPRNIIIFIGPEGDFTEEEFDLAARHGFIGVSLGSPVLRVDTAAIAASGFIALYENS